MSWYNRTGYGGIKKRKKKKRRHGSPYELIGGRPSRGQETRAGLGYQRPPSLGEAFPGPGISPDVYGDYPPSGPLAPQERLSSRAHAAVDTGSGAVSVQAPEAARVADTVMYAAAPSDVPTAQLQASPPAEQQIEQLESTSVAAFPSRLSA